MKEFVFILAFAALGVIGAIADKGLRMLDETGIKTEVTTPSSQEAPVHAALENSSAKP